MPGMKIYEEVKDGTIDACNIYMRIEDISIPAGVSEEDKAQAQLMLSMIKGKDMTCTMSVAGFTGVALGPTVDITKCTGPLADLAKMGQTQGGSAPEME